LSRSEGGGGGLLTRALSTVALATALAVSVGSGLAWAADQPVSPSGPAANASAKPILKVAIIGDSFTSGEGANSSTYRTVLAPAVTEDGIAYYSYQIDPAHQSSSAPTLQALNQIQAANPGVDIQVSFVPVSGATRDSLYKPTQVGTPFEQPPQINAVTGADVVIVGIGGNDVGFSKWIGTVLTSTESTSTQAFPQFMQTLNDGSYQASQGQLLDKVSELAAPNATIISLGYPKAMPATIPGSSAFWSPVSWSLISQGEANMSNQLATTLSLNNQDASFVAAAKHPAQQWIFADVSNALQGNELFTGQEALNGLTPSNPNGSYHPNPLGYQFLASALQPYVEHAVNSQLSKWGVQGAENVPPVTPTFSNQWNLRVDVPLQTQGQPANQPPANQAPPAQDNPPAPDNPPAQAPSDQPAAKDQPKGNDQATPPQPDAPQPNAPQPNASQPDAAQPNTAQPNTGQPDAAQPSAGQPDASQPNTAQPNAAGAQPNAVGPDATQPAAPDQSSAQPDATKAAPPADGNPAPAAAPADTPAAPADAQPAAPAQTPGARAPTDATGAPPSADTPAAPADTPAVPAVPAPADTPATPPAADTPAAPADTPAAPAVPAPVDTPAAPAVPAPADTPAVPAVPAPADTPAAPPAVDTPAAPADTPAAPAVPAPVDTPAVPAVPAAPPVDVPAVPAVPAPPPVDVPAAPPVVPAPVIVPDTTPVIDTPPVIAPPPPVITPVAPPVIAPTNPVDTGSSLSTDPGLGSVDGLGSGTTDTGLGSGSIDTGGTSSVSDSSGGD